MFETLEFLIVPAAILAMIVIPSILFLKLIYLPYKKELLKHEHKHEKEVEQTKPVQKFNQFVENSDVIAKEAMTEYNIAISKGVKPEQLASLKQKADIAGMVASNKEIVQMIGEPLFKKALAYIKGIGV